MEKFLVAAWLDSDRERAAFHERLQREWLPARLADPGVRGLTLRERLPGQRTGPDALASLWLDGDPRAAADALRKGVARVELWRAEEHRQKPYLRDWPDGEPTPGFGMVALMRKAREKTREACQRYWVERHTDLALRVHQGMCGYVQNVVIEALTPGGADVIGIAELQFRTREDFTERMYVPPEARSEIYTDVPKFASLADSESNEMTELIARAPPGMFSS